MGKSSFLHGQAKLFAWVLCLALAQGFAKDAAKPAATAEKGAAVENAIHAEGGHDCAKAEADCPKDHKEGMAGKESKDGACCKKKGAAHEAKHGEAKAAPAEKAPAAAHAKSQTAKPAEAAKAPAQAH